MATYLKRTSKLFDLSLSRPSADVRLRDLVCPVCRGILIEPVTLPCTHNLCLSCLKGTFEHNSLSCPLCRLRVGSWLRTATKSETLVNHGLWEIIRTKFPKEVEDKHNGEERDLALDADYAANRILSAAGEIHREYEAQLQIAEEEMRRQRQAEQMASEALIQKFEAKHQQLLLAQLAQDELLAKTLAKKQITEKQREVAKCYNECLNTSSSSVPSYAYDASGFNVKDTRVNNVEASHVESAHLDSKKTSLPDAVRDNSDLRRTNMALLSKICAERYCKVKTSAYKNCCPKQLAVYNVMTKSFKHQAVPRYIQPCTSNYPTDPGCSTSQAYQAIETKEELRVPGDVVNSKKKSLGVEVCRTHGSLGPRRADDDDERIGSAESSGSHDSINQEIHHFKPIKTVPRTSFKISPDGKQIDPKLIRVVPIVKRVINEVMKPPSGTRRAVGCSWSAFRGKARQDAREKQAAHIVDTDTAAPIDQKPSTSLNQPQTVSSKSTKPQMSDARLDFVHESSFDNNKNYTKSVNKIINGTKVSKKLSLDDELDASRTTRKSWRTRVRNGMVVKSKRHRNVKYSRKGTELTSDAKDQEEVQVVEEEAEEENEVIEVVEEQEEVEKAKVEEEHRRRREQDDEPSGSSWSYGKTSPHNDERGRGHNVAVENIAERIKKRKVNAEKRTSKPPAEADASDASSKRSTRKRTLSERRDKSSTSEDQVAAVSSSRDNVKPDSGSVLKGAPKRQRLHGTFQRKADHSQSSTNTTVVRTATASKRSARTASSAKIASRAAAAGESNGARDRYNNGKFNYDSPPESCDETEECVPVESSDVTEARANTGHERFSDEEAIREQQRIEQILLQEREDFELARRLQAKFDEMEQVARRTRRARRVVEDADLDATGIAAVRTVRKARCSPANPSLGVAARTAKTVPKKKRGRPPKRVK